MPITFITTDFLLDLLWTYYTYCNLGYPPKIHEICERFCAKRVIFQAAYISVPTPPISTSLRHSFNNLTKKSSFLLKTVNEFCFSKNPTLRQWRKETAKINAIRRWSKYRGNVREEGTVRKWDPVLFCKYWLFASYVSDIAVSNISMMHRFIYLERLHRCYRHGHNDSKSQVCQGNRVFFRHLHDFDL